MATLSWQQHLHLVVGFTGAEGGTLRVRDKCFELKVVPRVAMLYQPPLPRPCASCLCNPAAEPRQSVDQPVDTVVVGTENKKNKKDD